MSQLRILLLEDDQALRQLTAEELTDASFSVTAVGSGMEAVSAVAMSTFDLAIIDVRMKGINGLEALALMRKHHFDLPCIVVTGYASEEDAARAASLGVRGYLHKPFKMLELLEKVEEIGRDLQHKIEREALEQDFSDFLEWSLQRLLSDHKKLTPATDLAAALADNWCLPPVRVRLVQVLTALRALELVPPDFLLELYEACGENWNGSGPQGLEGTSIPVVARIVAFVTRREGESVENFDPSLFEALKKIKEVNLNKAFRERRLLAGLGRALLSTGDSEGATKAFKSLLEDTREGPDAVAAYLGLAQITNSLKLFKKAVEAAARIGPDLAARTNLEAAMSLRETQPELTRKLLERVAQGSPALLETQLAKLAQWSPPEPVPTALLESVLEPKNVWLLAGHSQWLTPILCKCLAGGVNKEPIVYFFRNHSGVLRRCLRQDELEVAERVALAQNLREIGAGSAIEKKLEGDSSQAVREALRLATADGEEAKFPELRLLTLGSLEIYVGDTLIESSRWRSVKAQLILANVLSRKGGVPEDIILDAFWPDEFEKGKRGIYNAVALYRRLLRADPDEATNYILRQGNQIIANPNRQVWVDSLHFQELGQGLLEDKEIGELLKDGREMSRLYRGPFLESCYMDWALEERRKLEELYAESLLRVATKALDARHFREGLEFATEVCSFDPFHQPAHIVAMRCNIGLGRPEQAIRIFKKIEVRLINEFQTEPSIDMIRAFHEAKLL